MIKINFKLDINDDYDLFIKNKFKNNIISYELLRRSIDARSDVKYNYIALVKVKDESIYKNKINIEIIDYRKYSYPYNNINTNIRPIIVGSGPSGLFCAYFLCLSGVRPIIIEMGEKIEERVKTVEKFWNDLKLNINSNVSFGEGGAGTFSDGKLKTSIKDRNNIIREILKIFVKFGAKEDILYDNNPHIGTDILREVIINMRNYLMKHGCSYRFNTKLTNIFTTNNKISKIEVNNSEIINTNLLVLAIGNSSRDTYRMLYKNNLEMEAKSFAVGFRIMHDQEMININQYGKYYKKLGAANYKLTNNINNRGVYTFCMCPGGYVVNSSSDNNKLSINGMSYNKRDSKCSNSAVIVSITPKDFGNNPLDGILFQEKIENVAYNMGNGKILVQKLIDFHNNKTTTLLGSIKPLVKGDYILSNLNNIYPDFITKSIKESIKVWDNKIKGFNKDDTLLLGVETKTSSPIRMIRNNFMSNINGIFVIGEGAGYAGGITSSAKDGIEASIKIIEYIKKIGD